MFGLGRIEELIVILIIILLLFGARKLPELSKGVADSIRELRRAFSEDTKKKDETPSTEDKK